MQKPKKIPNSSACADLELRWIQLIAALASMIGIMGLIALLSESTWAEDPPRGFQPGPRSFSNPFFDDEEDDFAPSEAPQMRPRSEERENSPKNAARNSEQSTSPPPSSQPQETLSAGGGPPGGVISPRKVAPISVDDETGLGEGAKEVVTDFNFPDADILDIAKTLGKLTGKNFILDKEVKGRITIISNAPITVGDAWKAFLTALDINGFALIPSGKYIRIARQRDARDKQLRTYTGDFSPESDALITRVFPLKYIDSDEITRTFRSFMPSNSRIIPHDQTNTIIVTDTGSNIAKLSKMLEILDVEGYDVGIDVISVKYASAVELSKLIDTLIPGTGGNPGVPGGPPRFSGSGRFNARRTKEGGVINTIISDERTNTLIVNANSKGVEQVKELVAKLDQKLPAQVGGGKVHVVYLQFAEAEQISNTLNNLSSQSGIRPPVIGAGGTGVNPVTSSLFEGVIKISPDKATNSLVITASPTDFATTQRVINQLDIPRDQVYVEVVILEVTLTRGFDWSSNVALPTSTPPIGLFTNKDLQSFITNPFASTGAVFGFGAGKTSEITLADNKKVTVSSVMGLIKLIQTHSKANVLATPQIIALDNTEAKFESKDKVPVGQKATATQGVVATEPSIADITLSINVKPQINKMSNFIKLKIAAKLGDFSTRPVPEIFQASAKATLERSVETEVVVGDSDTVVLGGLIRDKAIEEIKKIPLLGDIPLLGWLFRSKSTAAEKTNLLIFLTPHIVRQYEKVRALLDKKLKERDDFLERQAGGDDPLRHYRDDLIRNLPDIKEIISKKPQTALTVDEDTPAAVAVPPEGSTPPTTPVVVPTSTATPATTPTSAPTPPLAPKKSDD